MVVYDVAQRLGSLLSHWNDEVFRHTIMVLATEEASFWEPRTASLEMRSSLVQQRVARSTGVGQIYTHLAVVDLAGCSGKRMQLSHNFNTSDIRSYIF